MNSLLLLSLLAAPMPQQGQGLLVSAVLDRDRLPVGEELTVTLRVSSNSAEPIRFVVPALDGFVLVSRVESADVVSGNPPRRSAVLELRLQATRGGTWRIWPIRIEQQFQVVVAPQLEVQVDGGATNDPPPANAEVARLMRRVPPPRAGDVTVATVLSRDDATVGQQVDLATVAWFPRSLLARLRRPPTLKPPTVDGVWNLPQSTSPGVVASRLVGNEWHDLFLTRQVFFPLTAGSVTIPSASLNFAVPEGRQFFSQERRYDLESDVLTLVVRPVPAPPAGITGGPTAAGLSIRYQVPDDGFEAGALSTLSVVVEGEGNVTLWPEPGVTWPPTVRAYPDRVEETVRPVGGRSGGRKVFHFNVLPDSAGPIVLPELRYPYFDADRDLWSVAVAPSAVLRVAPVARLPNARAPVPLRSIPTTPILVRWWSATPWPVWFLVGFLPVGALAVRQGWRRRKRRAGMSPATSQGMSLERWVQSLLPPGLSREPDQVREALRRRGVPPDLAREAAAAYERLRSAEYGPSGVEDDSGGVREKEAALRERLRHVLGPVGGLVLLLVAGEGLAGQMASADSLYRTGRVRGALEAYQGMALRVPNDPGVWYRVGLAAFATGDDAVSAAALLRARRLAPRSPAIRSAWNRLTDSTRGRLDGVAPVWPVRSEELFLAALVLWVTGWVLGMARARYRRIGAVLLLAALAVGGGGKWISSTQRVPAGFARKETPVRLAPHGLAAETGTVPALALLRIEARVGAWVRVHLPGGRPSWIAAADLALVRTGSR